MEYLGFWVNKNGIRPIKKLEAVVNMTSPKTKQQLNEFIGLVSFYRDTWDIRSHLLQPLTTLTLDNATFKWTDVKKIV